MVQATGNKKIMQFSLRGSQEKAYSQEVRLLACS